MAENGSGNAPTRAELSAILKAHKPGESVIGKQRAVVLAACRNCSTLAKMANKPSCVVIVRAVGKHRTKAFTLVSTDRVVPALLCVLFPAKKPPTPRANLMACCRELIGSQIVEFDRQFWAATASMRPGPRCPLSGRSLRANRTHVDHIEPFVRLVEQWAAEQGMTCNELGALVRTSRKLKRLTMNEQLDASWIQWHLEHATLQIVCAKANLQKGAKQ